MGSVSFPLSFNLFPVAFSIWTLQGYYCSVGWPSLSSVYEGIQVITCNLTNCPTNSATSFTCSFIFSCHLGRAQLVKHDLAQERFSQWVGGCMFLYWLLQVVTDCSKSWLRAQITLPAWEPVLFLILKSLFFLYEIFPVWFLLETNSKVHSRKQDLFKYFK